MNWVRDWLDMTACPALDPERNQEVETLAHQMGRAMRQEGKFFNLDHAAAALNIETEDLPLVRDRLYELSLKFVLKDFNINDKDRGGLRWVARNLKLTPEQARQIEMRVGRKVFEEYLAFGIAGGFLDPTELAELRSIATCLQVTTRQLVLEYLADSGADFLYRIMEGMAEDGKIPEQTFKRLISSTEELGVDGPEFITELRKHAEDFKDRIRSRAEANGGLTANQIPPMESLLAHLQSIDHRQAS